MNSATVARFQYKRSLIFHNNLIYILSLHLYSPGFSREIETIELIIIRGGFIRLVQMITKAKTAPQWLSAGGRERVICSYSIQEIRNLRMRQTTMMKPQYELKVQKTP